jgi:RNA polymerase sigma-70 factor, ECF subfamily
MKDLKATFIAFLPPNVRAEMVDVADLESRLQELCRAASEPWPEIRIDETDFLQFLAVRTDPTSDASDRLDKFHGPDLYLVCALLQGSETALTIFETRYLRQVQNSLGRINLPAAEAEETIQELRERLLVGREGAQPGLQKYSGRGKLQAWLRVTATHAALRKRKTLQKEVPLFESVLLAQQATDEDPETALLKRTYRAEFKNAFRLALSELPARDRALLKMRFMDNLSVQNIAETFGMHRASASRALGAAKKQLFVRTEAQFHDQLNLSQGDFRSVMNLIQSRLEITFRNLLDEDDSPST